MGGRSGQSVGAVGSSEVNGNSLISYKSVADSAIYSWTTNKSENARILAGIAEKEGYKVEIQAFGAGNSSIAMAANGKIYINKTSKLLTDPTKNMDAQYRTGWLSTNNPEGIIHHEIAHLKFKT